MRFDITLVKTAVFWDVTPCMFVNTSSYFKFQKNACTLSSNPHGLPPTSNHLTNFLKFILIGLSPISYSFFQVDVFHRITGHYSVWYLFLLCPAAVAFRSVVSRLRDGWKGRAITVAKGNTKYPRKGERSRRDNCCVKIIKWKGIQRMPETDKDVRKGIKKSA